MHPIVSTVGAAPHEKKLAAIVAAAIEIAPPERIILFGSAAGGELVEDGGLDLAGGGGHAHRRCVAGRISAARPRRSGALDITILLAAVVEANRHDPCCYVHDALREGRVFYYVADVSPLDPE